MNDVLLSVDLPIAEVRLRRGKRGLGFNIGGGNDMPHVTGEPGIYVTKVRRDGAAYKDGRIRAGDRIVAINDTNLEDVTHNAAVKAFINASDTITLRVQHGAKNYILDNRQNIERYSVASPRIVAQTPHRRSKRSFDYGTLLVFVAGASVVAWLLYKYKPWTTMQKYVQAQVQNSHNI